jgi:tight adherence protein C
MSDALLLGAGTGIGIVLILHSRRSRRPRLSTALQALERPRAAAHRRLGQGAFVGRPAALVVGQVTPADLALAERTTEQHVLRKLAAAAVLAALPFMAALLAATGGVTVRPGVVVPAAVIGGIVGMVAPDLEVRSVARERRAEFVHALSSYLDVTAVLLAGGAGTESALHTAAELGDGWPQQRLRTALDRCRLTGQTPWDVLAALGDHLQVDELSQLATSLQLAGEQGARVRMTLTERARALRAAQLAAVEARARSVTEQMSVPVALLAVAFMLFVGFPAVWVVLGTL